MTAEAKFKEDWIEGWMDDHTEGLTLSVARQEDFMVLAEAAWKKHCEDGSEEMENRDLGCHDLARSDGGIR